MKRYSLFVLITFLLTFCTIFNGVIPVQAQINYPLQSRILQTVVEPTDGSIYVLWSDAASYYVQKNYISHYTQGGQQLGTPYTVPVFEGTRQANFVMIPGSPRYYYPLYKAQSDGTVVVTGVRYLELLTGNSYTLVNSSPLPECLYYAAGPLSSFFESLLIYNPVLKRLYYPCFAKSNYFEPTALVIDVATTQITGTLSYTPLAYNQVNGKLYALKGYMAAPPVGFGTFPYADILTLDAKTEAPTSDKLLLEKYGPAPNLNSFLVNGKTGSVFFAYSSCYAKCVPPYMEAYDKDGNHLVSAVAAPVERFELLNEATNQLYGMRRANLNRENIAVSGADLTGPQLAGFYWNTLAVDNTRNLVYSVDNRSLSGNSPKDRGAGLLVMDGNNFDIIRFIPIRPADADLLNYAKPLSMPPADFHGMFFPQTGHTLSGKFLAYWNSHGGLSIFGYPITEVFEDYNTEDGIFYQTQYFERNRFELHPEKAGTPFEVELGLLGRSFSSQTGPAVSGRYNSGETSPVEGGLLFLETGHTLKGKFLEYWQKNGGLSIFGLPVTEPFTEVNPIDNKTYIVQYFERNRFELHPEFAGSPYEVELGLLGVQVLRSHGWPIP